MKRLTGILSLVVTLTATSVGWAQSLVSAKPEDVGLSSERLEKIGVHFKGQIETGKIPGVVIMIARKGKLAYAESFGFLDKEKALPMPKDAIFRAYSMTKPLVSVGAMMLVEDGRIQLTDAIAKYLPEFHNQQVSVPKSDPLAAPSYTLAPAEHPATVQDLLRHTAGLSYGELTSNKLVKDALTKAGLFKPDFEYNVTDLGPEEEVERLAKAPLAHQPGTVWEYSLAVDVLGRLIEKASGKRLGTFLSERLFGPLTMVDTGFSVPLPKQDRLAEPLPKDPATGNPNRLIDVRHEPQNDSGGAGAVTTATDYLRFAQMMLEGGKLDQTRILSRTTVTLMTSDQLAPHISRLVTPGELVMGVLGYTFGLGFGVRLQPGVAAVPGSQGEFLWAGYAGTFFWVDPKEDLAVVMMMQAPGPTRTYFRREIKALVYQAIVD
jgi:CubicO group peptidase (beta-lactamase class C family)